MAGAISLSPAFNADDVICASLGGAAIGAIAACRLAGTGKTLPSSTPDTLVTGGVIAGGYFLSRNVVPSSAFDPLPTEHNMDVVLVCAAGIMVGVGAKLGQGCTCGNGIQGLSAMSPASLVHVLVFMAAGVITATMGNVGSSTPVENGLKTQISWPLLALAVAAAAAQLVPPLPATQTFRFSRTLNLLLSGIRDVAAGAGFASALVLSTMVKPSKVATFLDVLGPRGWDPSLMFVMGGALCVAFPAYQFLKLVPKSGPICEWAARGADVWHVLGGTLFGSGWALCGICPGPALVNCGRSGSLESVSTLFVVSMFGSRKLVELFATDSRKGAKAE